LLGQLLELVQKLEKLGIYSSLVFGIFPSLVSGIFRLVLVQWQLA
jgi:hypothetical protein